MSFLIRGKKYKMTWEQGKHINGPHLHTLVSQSVKTHTNGIRQFISHYSIVYLPLLYVKDKGRNQMEEKGKLLSPPNEQQLIKPPQITDFYSKRNRLLSDVHSQAHQYKCSYIFIIYSRAFIFRWSRALWHLWGGIRRIHEGGSPRVSHSCSRNWSQCAIHVLKIRIQHQAWAGGAGDRKNRPPLCLLTSHWREGGRGEDVKWLGGSEIFFLEDYNRIWWQPALPGSMLISLMRCSFFVDQSRTVVIVT